MKKKNNMTDINISGNAYGYEAYKYASGTMPGRAVPHSTSGVISGITMQEYEARKKQEEKAKVKKMIGVIALIVLAAVLSAFLVWAMQPMDLVSNIVVGVAMFSVLLVRLMIID